MKKYLLALAIFIAPVMAMAAPPAFVAPSSGSSPVFSFTVAGDSTAGITIFPPGGGTAVDSNNVMAYCSGSPDYDAVWPSPSGNGSMDVSAIISGLSCAQTGTGTEGTYTIVVMDGASDMVLNASCGIANNPTPNLATCESQGVEGVDWEAYTYDWSSTPTPTPASGLPGLISLASDNFGSTTGFTMAAAVGWTGDNLIKLFTGAGLAVLYNLRYWLMALLIIGLIVFFSFRAFRFFRH